MTLAIGRRRLVISFHVEPRRRASIDLPEAMVATDVQLVRLASRRTEADRQRLEADLALMGYWPLG